MSEARLPFVDPSEIEERRLLFIVERAIRDGDLYVLRPRQESAEATASATVYRRLIQQIGKQAPDRLAFAGRYYKLVADVDLAGIPDRNDYEVVGHNEAVRVLTGLAAQAAAVGLPDLLRQAIEKLTADWRPPFKADGIVLLRRTVVVRAQSRDVGQAFSPSALRKLRDEGWIEIAFVDAGMEPVADVDFDLRLVDGQFKSGKTNEKGFARIEGIDPGECRVRFPKVKVPVVRV